MKIKLFFIVLIVCFCSYCGFLISESGLIVSNKGAGEKLSLLSSEVQVGDESEAAEASAESAEIDGVTMEVEEARSVLDLSGLSAKNQEAKTVVLGSVDPESDFFFELTVSSKGAAIERARLNGFFSRIVDDEPLTILSPVVDFDGSVKNSLASAKVSFEGVKGAFPLYKLDWQMGEVKSEGAGAESVELSTVLFTPSVGDVLKITKIYLVVPGQRHFECYTKLENLTQHELELNFDVQSPVGFDREGVRMDQRKVTVAYQGPSEILTEHKDLIKLRKNKVEYLNTRQSKYLEGMEIEVPKNAGQLLWAATSNKYFTSIVNPVVKSDADYRVSLGRAECYDSKIVRGVDFKKQPRVDGSENVGFKLQYSNFKLAAAGKAESVKGAMARVYLGPKEKNIFEKNELYNNLGFIHAIDFKMCCGNLFRPISFFILWLMKTMYYVIPNYGIIIIILVLLVRVALHPLTKKGQVSMMRMGKMGPKVEELKKKYGDNREELNKRMMEIYREQGVSPMLGFLPMILQMPIWISLYSAIYASIDLRGAQFLPFWITDLSAPDALISFAPFTVPMVGWEISSFNLLPILLGLAMYLQQKMMPNQAAASASPQMAQQQKMMLIMMPLMMFIFLYKAPSGLNLYIMASVFGGVVEQKVIRKHIKEKEEQEKLYKVPVTKKTGGKLKKKKPKPFFRDH